MRRKAIFNELLWCCSRSPPLAVGEVLPEGVGEVLPEGHYTAARAVRAIRVVRVVRAVRAVRALRAVRAAAVLADGLNATGPNIVDLAERKILKSVPLGPGTLPTHTPLFVVLLVAVIIIIGALSFFPALALGPIVEHLNLVAK